MRTLKSSTIPPPRFSPLFQGTAPEQTNLQSTWLQKSSNWQQHKIHTLSGLTLALDLEATLVVSAHRPWPRPGLREFLDWCYQEPQISRICIYTAVNKDIFLQVAKLLVFRGEAPAWFTDLEHFRAVEAPDDEWDPTTDEIMAKDLRILNPDISRVLLIDDNEQYILRSQRSCWIKIDPYDGSTEDRELYRVRLEISKRLAKR